MDVRNSTVSCSGKWKFLVLILAASFTAGNAALGAGHRSSRRELPAQIGRASLTVEDLKALLVRNDRDPSSQVGAATMDVAAPANPLKLTLDNRSVRKLAKTLAELEMQRIQYEEKVNNDVKEEIEKLRSDRKKIQTSRISSTSEKDPRLSRDLFDSFLSEANSKAKIEEALRQFDDQHLISIEFVEGNDSKMIQAVYVGETLAWSVKSGASEYARK